MRLPCGRTWRAELCDAAIMEGKQKSRGLPPGLAELDPPAQIWIPSRYHLEREIMLISSWRLHTILRRRPHQQPTPQASHRLSYYNPSYSCFSCTIVVHPLSPPAALEDAELSEGNLNRMKFMPIFNSVSSVSSVVKNLWLRLRRAVYSARSAVIAHPVVREPQKAQNSQKS